MLLTKILYCKPSVQIKCDSVTVVVLMFKDLSGAGLVGSGNIFY